MLDWPYGRLERALIALARRLQGTGGRLDRAGWHRYRIQPNRRSLPAHAWRRLDQAHHEHAGLSTVAATRLYQLAHNMPLDMDTDGWENDRGLRQLREHGLVLGDQPPFLLSAEVRYSLLLEEYPE